MNEEHYKAIREGAAIGAVAPRAQIAVTGQDRASYLQGLLTNDIQALGPGRGCYAAWLTPQGRMLTDLHVLESGDMILLDLPADQVGPTLERLDQFIFTEDVQVAALAGSLSAIWVHGPLAAPVLEAVVGGIGLGAWTDYQHGRFDADGAPLVIARIDQVGAPGYCVFADPARVPALASALQRSGAVRVDGEALEAARIEAGYPVFGVDMTADTIPLEAGIEGRAISFTKGCYVGQEVIIRVLHRGGGRVAKKLVLLRIDGGAPARGARVSAGEREVGTVTSAAVSPAFGAIALGYVHRDFVVPGTALQVDTPAGRLHAMVTERPVPSAA